MTLGLAWVWFVFLITGWAVIARDFKSFLTRSMQKICLNYFLYYLSLMRMTIGMKHKLNVMICNLHLLPDSCVNSVDVLWLSRVFCARFCGSANETPGVPPGAARGRAAGSRAPTVPAQGGRARRRENGRHFCLKVGNMPKKAVPVLRKQTWDC